MNTAQFTDRVFVVAENPFSAHRDSYAPVCSALKTHISQGDIVS